MGQKPSTLPPQNQPVNSPIKKLPLNWVLLGTTTKKTVNPNPEQPIKFQYKTRRKNEQSPSLPSSHAKEQLLNNPQQSPVAATTINNNNTTSKLRSTLNNNNHNKNLNNTLNNFHSNSNNFQNNETSAIIKNTNLGEFKVMVKQQNGTSNVITRTKSEQNLVTEKIRERHGRHRRKSASVIGRKEKIGTGGTQFGYEIQDVDDFLTKATIEKPANIPVVLAFPSVLYQTRLGGYQAEISLPLGMVVNAVFKNQNWLYVQTPHAEEGYVSYAACLPLGIIPSNTTTNSTTPSPCWEHSTDVFPPPSGNVTGDTTTTDVTNYSPSSDCSTNTATTNTTRKRHTATTTNNNNNTILRTTSTTRLLTNPVVINNTSERSVDQLYLRATGGATRHSSNSVSEYNMTSTTPSSDLTMMTTRHTTLLVVTRDYEPLVDVSGDSQVIGGNLAVTKGDVVSLLSAPLPGWFWVRSRDGAEGFIPAEVAGHGFL